MSEVRLETGQALGAWRWVWLERSMWAENEVLSG